LNNSRLKFSNALFLCLIHKWLQLLQKSLFWNQIDTTKSLNIHNHSLKKSFTVLMVVKSLIALSVCSFSLHFHSYYISNECFARALTKPSKSIRCHARQHSAVAVCVLAFYRFFLNVCLPLFSWNFERLWSICWSIFWERFMPFKTFIFGEFICAITFEM